MKVVRVFLLFVFLFFPSKNITAKFLEDLGPRSKFDWGSEVWGISWNPYGEFFVLGKSQDAELLRWSPDNIFPIETILFESDCYGGAWNASGNMVALFGKNPLGEFRVCSWDGTSLAVLSTEAFGSAAISAVWSPNDKYLAVAGSNAGNSLVIYEWDGASLNACDSKGFGLGAFCVSWSSNGKFVAVGGANVDADVVVYGWDEVTKTLIDLGGGSVKSHGSAAYGVGWSNDGKYLAVVGNNDTSDLIVYEWDGTILTLFASVDFALYAYSVAWSSDGKYLVVGGSNDSYNLIVYKLNSVGLEEVQSLVFSGDVTSVSWSPNNKFLAVGVSGGDYNIEIYYTPYTFNPSGKFENIDIINHCIFHDLKNSAGGVVQFEQGFTVLPDAQAYLGLYIPVCGPLDLRDTGKMVLDSDLYLDSDCTLSGGGIISGRGHTIFLNGDLRLPAHSPSILEFSSDTVIDGQGNEFTLDPYCQLLVDGGVTLTLRNLILKNTRNSAAIPPIRGLDWYSKICFDNVKLALNDDFVFRNGQIFINNDMHFTGTSSLIYDSVVSSYIEPHSCLLFDHQTSFWYNPSTANNNLFKLQDETSVMYLNNCSLNTSVTGMQLTNGRLCFDNKVTLNSNVTNIVNPDSQTGGIIDVFGGESEGWVAKLTWGADGQYIVKSFFSGGGRLKAYKFVGQNGFGGLQELGSGEMVFGGTSGGQVEALAISPDGRYLVASGFHWFGGSDYKGGIKTYRFVDGGTSGGLEEVGTGATYFVEDAYSGAMAVSWSPNGKYVVVGNGNFAEGFGGLKVFEFMGDIAPGGLQEICSGQQTFGGFVKDVVWSPDGIHIVAGFVNEARDCGEVKLYRFTGVGPSGGLEEVGTGSQEFGGGEFFDEQICVAFSPDGKYVAAGGDYVESEESIGQLKTYKIIDGGITGGLEEIGSGAQDFGKYVNGLAWSSDGKYVIACSYDEEAEAEGLIKVFDFINGGIFGGLAEVGTGFQIFNNEVTGLFLSPDGKYVAASSGESIKVFGIDYIYSLLPQGFSNGIIFGNFALGSDYNLDINVLGGARVIVDGLVWDDNAVVA